MSNVSSLLNKCRSTDSVRHFRILQKEASKTFKMFIFFLWDKTDVSNQPSIVFLKFKANSLTASGRQLTHKQQLPQTRSIDFQPKQGQLHPPFVDSVRKPQISTTSFYIQSLGGPIHADFTGLKKTGIYFMSCRNTFLCIKDKATCSIFTNISV